MDVDLRDKPILIFRGEIVGIPKLHEAVASKKTHGNPEKLIPGISRDFGYVP
jgi:hypothetical protein